MDILSINIHTPDLDASVKFYQQKIGLKQSGPASYFAGNSELKFTENPSHSGIYHFAFNIPCNQIREAMHWLENRAVPLVPDNEGNTLIDFSSWNAEATYFFDPAGNIVEFIARRDLHNESDKPFGPDSILEISEIGIVTEDVLAWNAKAAKEYGVLPFEKSKPGPDFSALGTDTGLFIVVPEGRIWYMTDLPATCPPLEMIVMPTGSRRKIKISL